VDEKHFKKHLRHLDHGHHHPAEHNWSPNSEVNRSEKEFDTSAGNPGEEDNSETAAPDQIGCGSRCNSDAGYNTAAAISIGLLLLRARSENDYGVAWHDGCSALHRGLSPPQVKEEDLREA
jgi:hypothetical protein